MLILIPILALLLAVTIMGLPLGLLLMAWFLPLLYLARIFPILWLGLLIFTKLNRPHQEKTAFTAGLFIYYLLALIPLVSSLLTIFVVLLGSGMVLLEKKETYHLLRAREML